MYNFTSTKLSGLCVVQKDDQPRREFKGQLNCETVYTIAGMLNHMLTSYSFQGLSCKISIAIPSFTKPLFSLQTLVWCYASWVKQTAARE